MDRQEIVAPAGDAIALRCNVAQEEDCRGGIDVLVNNADITHLGASVRPASMC